MKRSPTFSQIRQLFDDMKTQEAYAALWSKVEDRNGKPYLSVGNQLNKIYPMLCREPVMKHHKEVIVEACVRTGGTKIITRYF